MKKIAIIFSMIVTLGFISGCQSQTSSTSDKKEVITVQDAKGNVDIPANPQRIVDLSGNSDMLSILGYKVVGTANSDAYDYTKFPSYLENTLQGAKILGYSMQDTMDIEGILELNPDLIIISNVQEKMYKQLSEIAPTIMLELAQIDWTQDLASVAKIFHKEKEAQDWLNTYKAEAKKAGEKIKASYGEDTTYLALLASGGQLYIFDAAGIGGVLYDDMGLKKPDNMPKQENISLPVISYEGLAELDADHIFLVGTEEDSAALKANAIYKNLRAVKEGNVTELPSSPYFNIGYSPIGKKVFVEEVASFLEK